MYAALDAIQQGDTPWQSFSAKYTGPIPTDSDPPPWMTAEHQIWCRDILTVIRQILANPEFDGEFNYSAYREYVNDERRYSNVMSGNWAWKQSDIIAEDPSTHGSMFVPLILGSDKTTVSVATGHNEYYPLYLSIGNVFNNVRRAHKNALVVVGFLAIPKSERKHTNSAQFRKFRRQLFPQAHLRFCCRIAAIPAFAGLRRFPEGRDFKQWTGDDSKALMKVYLPAIAGLLPRDMIRTFSVFMEFCYLVRRSFITEQTLHEISGALDRFWHYHKVFEITGVRAEGFSLPRQHSLDHYVQHICNFGVPNGLCSSITESKHIKAVKEPWRRSNRFEALGQMLITNQRLDKLAAARVDFASRGLLQGTVLSDALQHIELEAGDNGDNPDDVDTADASSDWESGSDDKFDLEDDPEPARARNQHVGDVDGIPIDDRDILAHVELARHRAFRYPWTFEGLAAYLNLPSFEEMALRFVYEQTHRDDPDTLDAEEVPLVDCPSLTGRVSVFHSASTTFYAPSDISGIAGMRRERIRATPSWRSGPGRYDCVFVNNNEADGFRGLLVARVRMFFSFSDDNILYPCALVEWFSPVGNEPDTDTGMWIVEPDFDPNGRRSLGIIHLDAIVRAAHLIGVSGETQLPIGFKHTDPLDVFAAFYVNKYADHHSHEIAF
ncbi:hypothetical protein B0H21DRAFT_812581 [Amylocystis lapponica]|nr:hypothetical protein B0H21DRAFT_812581 [Amylocystis lapponica]